DSTCLVTTMVDYYGLPRSQNAQWPGRIDATGKHFSEKAVTVESAIAAAVNAEMPKSYDPRRSVPYVMMHEVEALLFSDCVRFSQAINQPQVAGALHAVRQEFNSPEEINDSPLTAPSKRVQAIVADYEKPLYGTLAILEIGLAAVREECPHFN